MRYKPYGTLGVSVSAVGFGGMRFDLSHSDQQNADLVRYALDQEITYFDTAPGYSNDRSETIFGLALSPLASQRQRFFIATKGMPELLDTADKAVQAVEKSLSRLKTDYIDFYHIWCIRRWSEYELAIRPGGQYEGLLRCQQRGLIRHIVVSTHLRGPDVARMLQQGYFKGVLLGFNILNYRYRWEGVQAAAQMGLGVVAMNPLAGGLIPQNEQALSFLAIDGRTPTETAIQFVVGCPEITVALIGFTTRQQVDMACRVADAAQPISRPWLEQIGQYLSEKMDALCTGCGYCMGRCPVEIPIAGYMQFYNQMLLAQKTDVQMANALASEKKNGILRDASPADWCVRCGRCERVCTQHLNITSRLSRIAEWERMNNDPQTQ